VETVHGTEALPAMRTRLRQATHRVGKPVWNLARRLAPWIVALIVLVAVWGVIWWIVNPINTTTRINTLRIMAAVGGAAIVSVGSYVAWQNLKVSRDGQITKRLTRAIDQLGATYYNGNPRLEIRLGRKKIVSKAAR
jgi:hypothetical protein